MTDENIETEVEKEENEFFGCLLRLFLVIIIFAFCFTGPLMISIYCGDGWGVLAAFVAIPFWRYVGSPPCPGFLNGIVCITGLGILVMIFILKLVQWGTVLFWKYS